MRKNLGIFLLVLTAVVPALSQPYFAKAGIDSLNNTLLTAGDTQKVNIWNLLALHYLSAKNGKSHQSIARYYFENALSLGRTISYNKGIANALFNEAISKRSLPHLRESLTLLKLSGDEWGVAACFDQMAGLLNGVGENRKAILYYDSAQHLFRKLGDTSSAAWCIAWKGHSYFNLGNYQEAYTTGQTARELAKQTDTLLQILTLAHLANLFLGAGLPLITIQYLHKILDLYPSLMNQKLTKCTNLSWALERGGEAYLQLNQVDSALLIAEVLQVPFEDRDVSNHMFYGRLYMSIGEYEKALPHFREGYEAARRSSQLISLASHAEALGQVYLVQKNFSKAIYYSREALHVAGGIHALLEMKNASGTLAEIYGQVKDYSRAYHYSKLNRSFNDSLAPETYKRKLSLMEVQNELEIQQQQAELLARENQLTIQQLKNHSLLRKILLGGIAAGGLLGLIAWRNTHLKRKNESHRRVIAENELYLQYLADETARTELEKQATDLEMRALRAQINPHFIFNCLSSINCFILRNDSETASNYLAKFSRLIRLVLNNSTKTFVTLKDEIDILRLYLELERLRFRYSFEYNFSFKNEIDLDNTSIPPLLLQPFVENAIWHGLMHIEHGGWIEIAFGREEEVLTCTINDNGIGREKAAYMKTQSAEKQKSMGLQITIDRLVLLNKGSVIQSYFNIADVIDDAGKIAGTRVTLKIPCKGFLETVA